MDVVQQFDGKSSGVQRTMRTDNRPAFKYLRLSTRKPSGRISALNSWPDDEAPDALPAEVSCGALFKLGVC